MKRNNIFMLIAILGLVIGNIVCLYYNGRLLHTLTNVVMGLLIFMNFGKNSIK